MNIRSAIPAFILLAGVAVRYVDAQAPASVQSGVYTDAQATRGGTLYQTNCSSCHGDKLEGGGQAPPLAGNEFKGNWKGQALSDLFTRMQTSMPADRPGTLAADQNADILSWILKQNGFPAGSAVLQGDAEVLKSIKF